MRIVLAGAVVIVASVAALVASSRATGGAQDGRLIVRAAECEYRTGFKALQELIPAVVGDCLKNEQHNPENGDGLQPTSKGLLVWRKSDNWTAFTDGHRTWVNGPFGLQARANNERFPWESAVSQPRPDPSR